MNELTLPENTELTDLMWLERLYMFSGIYRPEQRPVLRCSRTLFEKLRQNLEIFYKWPTFILCGFQIRLIEKE